MNEPLLSPARGRHFLYGGLSLVALATLMFEILLTRIFSVTLWYHFAFMAISIAMFGMTVGALGIFLWPRLYTAVPSAVLLGHSALGFAGLLVVSVGLHLLLPVGKVDFMYLTLQYLLASLPFVSSGMCVSFALTKLPLPPGRLYAADLSGAALGCLLLIALMKLTDGLGAVFATAAIAALGGLTFLWPHGGRWRILAFALMAVFAVLAVGHTALARRQLSPVRIHWAKGFPQPPPIYEKWNSFSRLAVVEASPVPLGWGLSRTYHTTRRVEQYWLLIDAAAGTLLTRFDGDLDAVDYLKYDVTNLVHYLRPAARVLVIGVGGGRDLLTALAFKQPHVVGVEMNEDIVDLLTRTFGDFTGHLERYPEVRIVNDEARSFVARHPETFDIIHSNYIDTWAATAAGAFVLTENALYTLEAWTSFLRHLTPQGVLSVSRTYSDRHRHEAYRLITLARAALAAVGAERPADHLLVITDTPYPTGPYSMVNILVSRRPFLSQELRAMGDLCRRLGFEILLAPDTSFDAQFRAVATATNLRQLEEHLRLRLEPPTDDSPFFFNMLRLQDLLRGAVPFAMRDANLQAVATLGVLLVIVCLLTAVCILLPLGVRSRLIDLSGASPLLLFFAAIGCGFMLIEIALMQWLIIFLGHPVYGLSVILFALLISAGAGSLSIAHMPSAVVGQAEIKRLTLVLVAVSIVGLALPALLQHFASSTTPVRIGLAVAALLPLGGCMGMAFPLGMKLACQRAEILTPWLWGVNGATSVLASVVAVAIAITWSISISYWTGAACYLLAAIVFAAQSVRNDRSTF
jgi:hypothetical protein